jgi:microcystin degradation protein MlrC
VNAGITGEIPHINGGQSPAGRGAMAWVVESTVRVLLAAARFPTVRPQAFAQP